MKLKQKLNGLILLEGKLKLWMEKGIYSTNKLTRLDSKTII